MASAVSVDMLGLAASAFFAYLISAFVSDVLGWEYSSAAKVFQERSLTLPFLAVGVVGWFFLAGHYHSRTPFWDEARKVFAASAVALMAEGFLMFAWKADGSRLATFLTWMLLPFAVMIGRDALRRVLRALGIGAAKAAIIGRPAEAAVAARVISADGHMGYIVSGTVHTVDPDTAIKEAFRLGADTAVVALSGDDASENVLAARLRDAGFKVVIVPPTMGLAASGMKVQYVIGQDAVLMIDKIDIIPRLSKLAKRTFDLSVTTTVLAMLAIPMLAIAVLVRRDGGPAIFGHERVGAGGSKFRCLKFRSMANDAEARLHEYLAQHPGALDEWILTRKLRNDPRVTPLGRFIRKAALDELPQLFNVLRGDMSLVGPRPVTLEELDRYGAAADLYLSVRPGMTGLWQVSGRNDLSYEQRVALDAWYVNNWSPWHDTAIILKTFPALIFRRGAY